MTFEEILKEDEKFWRGRIEDYCYWNHKDVKFKVIEESFEIDDDGTEIDVDGYWSRGWFFDEFYEFSRKDYVEWSDSIYYRTFPTRYRLKDFRLSKSLRRVLNKNKDLKTVVRPLRITPAKIALYEKYHKRLYDHILYNLNWKYAYAEYFQTRLMETGVFYQDRLIAGSVFQLAKRSVTSDVGFWDWEDFYDRSLGILTVLLEMQWAASKGFEYYYLGEYHKQSRLFQYKLRFPALEFYDWDNDCWIDAKAPEASALLDQKLDFYFEKQELGEYFDLFQIFVETNKDAVAGAIIGSHANGTASESSDVDFLILTTDAQSYFKRTTTEWAQLFSAVREQRIENRGAFQTIRAFYRNGLEFEFNLASPDWAGTNPIDDETRRVVEGGMKILYDPQGILEKLQKSVAAKTAKKKQKLKT
jgi:arginine-tRNA-protein transferase